jgi:hypothetical protein
MLLDLQKLRYGKSVKTGGEASGPEAGREECIALERLKTHPLM